MLLSRKHSLPLRRCVSSSPAFGPSCQPIVSNATATKSNEAICAYSPRRPDERRRPEAAIAPSKPEESLLLKAVRYEDR